MEEHGGNDDGRWCRVTRSRVVIEPASTLIETVQYFPAVRIALYVRPLLHRCFFPTVIDVIENARVSFSALDSRST